MYIVLEVSMIGSFLVKWMTVVVVVVESVWRDESECHPLIL